MAEKERRGGVLVTGPGPMSDSDAVAVGPKMQTLSKNLATIVLMTSAF